MPRSKKPMPVEAPAEPARDISGWTTPRQFRLSEATLAELDAIAAHMERKDGSPHSRADAIRYAARKLFSEIREEPANSG